MPGIHIPCATLWLNNERHVPLLLPLPLVPSSPSSAATKSFCAWTERECLYQSQRAAKNLLLVDTFAVVCWFSQMFLTRARQKKSCRTRLSQKRSIPHTSTTLCLCICLASVRQRNRPVTYPVPSMFCHNGSVIQPTTYTPHLLLSSAEINLISIMLSCAIMVIVSTLILWNPRYHSYCWSQYV